MTTYHTVVQGEYLSGIAAKYGFSTFKSIWDHPQNAELKKKRQNPNVIFPGDRLFIPDRVQKLAVVGTSLQHQFVLKAEKLKLRLALEGLHGKPIANAKCDLTIDGQTFPVTTDDQGKFEQDIKRGAQGGSLTVKGAQTPIDGMVIPVKIGHLDPVDEVAGQQARLNNLGYFAGPFEGSSAEENKALFLSAVEEFQCDHGLLVDGKCGPATQAKLKQVHGS